MSYLYQITIGKRKQMGQIIFSARLIVRHRKSFQIKIYQLNQYAYDFVAYAIPCGSHNNLNVR